MLFGDEKINEIANLAGRGCGKETILREISKCDVVCANCHRKIRRKIERKMTWFLEMKWAIGRSADAPVLHTGLGRFDSYIAHQLNRLHPRRVRM